MEIKIGDAKEKVYRELINMGLKNKRVYCNNCGKPYTGTGINCCNDPQIGTNYDHTRSVLIQNRMIRSSRLKQTGANANNTLRFGVSIPRWMYELLDNFEKTKGAGNRLFKDKHDVIWFAKTFKAFAIPERI